MRNKLLFYLFSVAFKYLINGINNISRTMNGIVLAQDIDTFNYLNLFRIFYFSIQD